MNLKVIKDDTFIDFKNKLGLVSLIFEYNKRFTL